MNLEPLRRLQSKLTVAFVAAAALVLSSCGGGGATSSPNSTGALQLTPGTASIYAGVPYTLNISGGLPPYLVTSSEPTLVELNFTTSDHAFTFVARNPGVVDVGLDPNEVPRRTVNIQVRDSAGTSISNAYNILQNFFTGYRAAYSSTCAASGTNVPQACSGTDTIVNMAPVSNGALYGNREFEFRKTRGDFQWVVENPQTVPQLVDTLRVRTDHEGKSFARMRVTAAAPTQIATFTVTDVATGATTSYSVTIVQQPVVDVVSLLPDTVTFTGTLSTRCGYGTADVFVFGGTPPYTVTPNSGLAVSPTTVDASGGRFAVTAPNSPTPCPTGSAVIVTDSRGAVGRLTVDIQAGSGTPTALTVVPNTIASLACGTSTTVTALSGVGPIAPSSSHPRITAAVSGSTVTITRLAADPLPLGSYPASATITLTDGATIQTVTVTATPTGGC